MKNAPMKKSAPMPKAPKGPLSTKTRNDLPMIAFGLPAQRKYPMPNASHAANAKARATQQAAKGNLTPGQKSAIFAKANKVLGKKR